MSIYRTYQPKVPVYKTDGTGRDTYIKLNNGGIFKNISHSVTRGSTRVREYSPPHPVLRARTLKYRGNGTGRDTYIIDDSGGLCSSSFTVQSPTILRDNKPKTANIITTRVWKNFKERFNDQLTAKKQQENTTKLSVPRYLTASPGPKQVKYSPERLTSLQNPNKIYLAKMMLSYNSFCKENPVVM